MFEFILILHIGVSLALIAIILFQAGKGAGLANIFGGGSSGLFTPSAGGFLGKFTAILAAIFLISSLYLSLFVRGRIGPFVEPSIIERALEEEPILPIEELIPPIEEPTPPVEERVE